MVANGTQITVQFRHAAVHIFKFRGKWFYAFRVGSPGSVAG